jgi:hypothetical protein
MQAYSCKVPIGCCRRQYNYTIGEITANETGHLKLNWKPMKYKEM